MINQHVNLRVEQVDAIKLLADRNIHSKREPIPISINIEQLSISVCTPTSEHYVKRDETEFESFLLFKQWLEEKILD